MSRSISPADDMHAPGRKVGLDEVPIVDFAPYLSGDPDGERRVVAEVDHALREIGFMYVRNVGFPAALRDDTFAAMRRFFARDAGYKQRLAWLTPESNRGYVGPGVQALDPRRPGDLKEAFDTGAEAQGADAAHVPSNRWPADDPSLRATVLAYYEASLAAAKIILSAMERALSIAPGTFTATHDAYANTLRLLHYPPVPHAGPQENQIRAGAHTDFGSITLLSQHGEGGLEVRNKRGEWLMAPAINDAMIINTGDCMQRWTNNVFRSTGHRVALPNGVDTNTSRYSIAFFCSPAADTTIECLPGCERADGSAIYPPITAGKHILKRLNETYGTRDKARK
ncbi:isopenicillin-N synthase protein [Salinisphaera shabanensis E1L3A]|uniref:2-oxoglutarate-dependent ethylene/succinate-forming enzyme n=1 Tax=Salinisphaera shabanensis E1L3A TaxID=1033802 RepID=U2ENB9_9GAMM|nr:2-oxoglutarate and iron-dependent oxygenase domain-containing protein [Salinisphaera shabanensis]ERJ19627.1 isopenicillin-N synthase protein [Salinisphaera shabanensis E1L3A]